ncbi:ferrous iron transport protein B [Salipaludibacillus daqingensis]|uniref:ferrous iron transport protein B n=1 Tax=Salipaludibacillus daqingensis TaxID=3041001 RepID=UPI0024733189|nr:ferrous iron transport protein B [Salipaludibacillus daqingensis]
MIALLGNPNTGKTSLFNALTDSYEYVGNWSGVTVDKKVGNLRKGGELVDLPGVYSLNPVSKDETVVSTFLIEGNFDSLINIVDASQLNRSLHLTIQLLEFGCPFIVGLNMADVAQTRGIKIDVEKMANFLQVPVRSIVARKKQGIDELEADLINIKKQQEHGQVILYAKPLEALIQKLEGILPLDLPINKRWAAIQYIDDNPVVKAEIQKYMNDETMNEIVNEHMTRENITEEQLRRLIRQGREKYIHNLIAEVVNDQQSGEKSSTEKIDKFVTHPVLGIPTFIALMYLMFMLTFNWLGFPISDLLEGVISGPITTGLEAGLTFIGASAFLESMILDGIVAGVGGVLVFVPQIFILFFFISLLEDSGYMARVATVMDRLMQVMGLNGKAFIPMIIGFGCNVPGVMAARTIEQPRERLITILLTPLMSCSARLPVYALFAGAFFAQQQAFVVLSLYILGVVLALLMAKLLSKSMLKSEESFFIMELPPYRIPQPLTLWRSTWEKGKGFLRKAGTYIFAGSVIIWLLTYTGPGGIGVEMNDSFLAAIGGWFSPLFAPLGFGTWQASAALITGFLAKEIVVATMAILYVVPEASMHLALSEAFTPIAAYSFMVFILIYVPCLATVAVIKKETDSMKLTLFSMAYAFILAYGLSFLIYQVGTIWFAG